MANSFDHHSIFRSIELVHSPPLTMAQSEASTCKRGSPRLAVKWR
jgi:hypothetical protein